MDAESRTNILIVLVCILGVTAFVAILVAVSRPEPDDSLSSEMLAATTLRTFLFQKEKYYVY